MAGYFRLFRSNNPNKTEPFVEPMVRETRVQSQVKSYQRLKKMVRDAALLNPQHYKLWIKGKVNQFQGMEQLPPLHLGVVAIKKGALGSPSTKVANITFS